MFITVFTTASPLATLFSQMNSVHTQTLQYTECSAKAVPKIGIRHFEFHMLYRLVWSLIVTLLWTYMAVTEQMCVQLCVRHTTHHRQQLRLTLLEVTHQNKIKVCKSVHHRTIKINHQPDATVFQFIILTFIYSSRCFGRFTAHYQELSNCSGSLWFYLRIVVTAVHGTAITTMRR